MSWVVVGAAAIGAVTADQQRRQAKKQNQQQASMAAAQTEFSPWTGLGAGSFSPVSEGQGALAGGAQGALGGWMHKQANAKPEVPAPAPMQTGAPLAQTAEMDPGELERRQRMMYGQS